MGRNMLTTYILQSGRCHQRPRSSSVRGHSEAHERSRSSMQHWAPSTHKYPAVLPSPEAARCGQVCVCVSLCVCVCVWQGGHGIAFLHT